MRVSKCGSDNPAGKKFCSDCSAPLTNLCSKCGADNPPAKRFCGDCGTSWGDASSPNLAGTGSGASSAAGERRHLTVLFCDPVGSTEIAARLDPEEWREVATGYHRAAAEAINRFGGYVAQYLGDGVMAYFGWPAAHDSDAERAARAALAILDAVLKLNLNDDMTSPKLATRVGIDSDTVVVGAGVDKDANGFDTIILRECVTTWQMGMQTDALRIIEMAQGRVISTRDFLNLLE